MTRQQIECADIDHSCTVAVTATDREQLLIAATHHAVHGHGYTDNDELRSKLEQLVKDA